MTGELPRGELHLSWVSVATFAAAIDGHVVLFDAYIHKEEDESNYVPAVTQDLVDLDPEYIIIGHGHFDHALEAGTIAVATGATIVGTRSHCDEAELFGGGPVQCLIAFENDAEFGDQVELSLWDGVCTTAILHPHSASEPLDPDHDPTNTVVPVPDPGSLLLHPLRFDLGASRWVLPDDDVCPAAEGDVAAGEQPGGGGGKSPLPATGAGAILGAILVVGATALARRRA
ncbi:MAG: hypothetical protein R3249_05670 [Nitriliruptorales bacterium]|nr:hypothetical protein [Nitriliruptorales bacterium]